MNRVFFLKNTIYALVFYVLAIAIAHYEVKFSGSEISFFITMGLISSLLFPFSLFFLKNKAKLMVNDLNWINFGFSIAILLSIPPIGLIFLIYYIIKCRP